MVGGSVMYRKIVEWLLILALSTSAVSKMAPQKYHESVNVTVIYREKTYEFG